MKQIRIGLAPTRRSIFSASWYQQDLARLRLPALLKGICLAYELNCGQMGLRKLPEGLFGESTGYHH